MCISLFIKVIITEYIFTFAAIAISKLASGKD